eukprot:GEMP01061706.1.p1 GENE.GEMP01061706.1~~GEMP01061706.1.p1  ORF type:complete len:190 (+),score=25.80 GEMP01061706.1:765-1334(+)
MLTSALHSIVNYTAEVLPQLAVQYGPVSLVELGLFFLTCVIVFFYSWFPNPQRNPSNKRGWWTSDANCVKSQHCASAILQLCQSRSSHHKGLQMYLDHRDHLTSAKNPHMSDWESLFSTICSSPCLDAGLHNCPAKFLRIAEASGTFSHREGWGEGRPDTSRLHMQGLQCEQRIVTPRLNLSQWCCTKI